jgi:hypothetical protein
MSESCDANLEASRVNMLAGMAALRAQLTPAPPGGSTSSPRTSPRKLGWRRSPSSGCAGVRDAGASSIRRCLGRI